MYNIADQESWGANVERKIFPILSLFEYILAPSTCSEACKIIFLPRSGCDGKILLPPTPIRLSPGKQYPHHYSVASLQLRRIIRRSDVNPPPGHFDSLLACIPHFFTLSIYVVGRTIYMIHTGVDTRLGGFRYSRCRLMPNGIWVMTLDTWVIRHVKMDLTTPIVSYVWKGSSVGTTAS
jgi:hypothetical protein